MRNILGNISPILRKITLAIIAGRASSLTAARALITAIPKAEREGIVLSRDVPAAFELYGKVKERRRMRRRRMEGRGTAAAFYGVRAAASAEAPEAAGRRGLARRMGRPLATRLVEEREERVMDAIRATMRHGASGGTEWDICVGVPDYNVQVRKDWSRVNRGRDTWASSIDAHTVRVGAGWMAQVARIGEGDGVIDGRMILGIEPDIETPSHSIMRVVLARSGRGFQAVVEDKFLSVYGRHATVHATRLKAIAAHPPAAPTISREDAAALAALA